MTRTSLTILLATSMVASVGCASKNYVRQETTPLINKTNELDDLTAKNSKDIKDVDARAQAGIQQVQAKLVAAFRGLRGMFRELRHKSLGVIFNHIAVYKRR